MLTCRDVADFLMEYLDGSLPFLRRVSFRFHILLCPACRRYLAQYRETVRLGQDAFCDEDPDAPAPEEVPDRLVKAILDSRE